MQLLCLRHDRVHGWSVPFPDLDGSHPVLQLLSKTLTTLGEAP